MPQISPSHRTRKNIEKRHIFINFYILFSIFIKVNYYMKKYICIANLITFTQLLFMFDGIECVRKIKIKLNQYTYVPFYLVYRIFLLSYQSILHSICHFCIYITINYTVEPLYVKHAVVLSKQV